MLACLQGSKAGPDLRCSLLFVLERVLASDSSEIHLCRSAFVFKLDAVTEFRN